HRGDAARRAVRAALASRRQEVRRDQGDDREGPDAHARHRGRRGRHGARRRVRVVPASSSPDPVDFAFAGGVLDRAGERRADAAWLEAARRDPAARAIVVGRAGVAPEPVALDGADADAAIFLGLAADGAPLFAIEREDVPLTGLRDLATSLPAAQLGTV